MVVTCYKSALIVHPAFHHLFTCPTPPILLRHPVCLYCYLALHIHMILFGFQRPLSLEHKAPITILDGLLAVVHVYTYMLEFNIQE